MILEVMGRYAGWIALEGHFWGSRCYLIPEIPYDIHKVAQKLWKENRGKSFSIIVVAEGAKDIEGDMVTVDCR